jgi:hypothetical protein
LPAIVLHGIAHVTRRNWWWVRVGYAIAGAFTVILIALPDVVTPGTCTGRYVVFTVHSLFGYAYAVYYYGGLLGCGALLLRAIRRRMAPLPLLRWMLIAYATFVAPTALLTMIVAATRDAVPSVMCGFAVLFAALLVFRVLPLEAKRRRAS